MTNISSTNTNLLYRFDAQTQLSYHYPEGSEKALVTGVDHQASIDNNGQILLYSAFGLVATPFSIATAIKDKDVSALGQAIALPPIMAANIVKSLVDIGIHSIAAGVKALKS